MDDAREKELLDLIKRLHCLMEDYAELLRLEQIDNKLLKEKIVELRNKKQNHYLSTEQKRKFLSVAKKVCANCRTIENLQIDHIIPKIKGGTDEISNLQFLCYKCHKAKHKKREAEEEIKKAGEV